MNILHFSDVHLKKDNAEEIERICRAMILDAKEIASEKNIPIDFVCFSGDMIQSGDDAIEREGQWELAEEKVIKPLLDALKLDKSRFIFTPGNHEVEKSKVDKYLEKGLICESQQQIEELYKDFDEKYAARMGAFYSIARKWHTDAFWGKIGYALQRKIGDRVVGFACVDSAWRSTGIGNAEKGKIFVSSNQIAELYDYINEADIKICIIHHPVDWLLDFEKKDVEKQLRKFDLVLSGHVHEESDKQIRQKKYNTIYITAGKIFPLDYAYGNKIDGYNGYSIISYDFTNPKWTMYFRSYYANEREEFGAAEFICKKGIWEYEAKDNDDSISKKLIIKQGLEQYYNDISVPYAQIRALDGKAPEKMRNALVEPTLYEKVDRDGKIQMKNVSLDAFLEKKENILVIGSKESGKTTTLQQLAMKYLDQYDKLKIIPVYVSMNKLMGGKDKIHHAAMIFAQDKLPDECKISKNDIQDALNDGDVVYLIDNMNMRDPNQVLAIENLIKNHENSHIIVTVEHDMLYEVDVKEYPAVLQGYRKIYIGTLGKHQIRDFVNQWTGNTNDESYKNTLVEKIDNFCNQINFAKTPFNISLLMVLADSDNNFEPINESLVMENYLEVLLEKLSKEEISRKSYGFRIKKDFLSVVAHKIFLSGNYEIPSQEFNDLLHSYHKLKGWSINETKFDKIFFEKNILMENSGYVSFTHFSFWEFFLAVYAYEDESFLDELTKKDKRIYFQNVICFYAGMEQNCKKLVNSLSESIVKEVIEHIDIIDSLNDMELVSVDEISIDEYIDKLKETRLSQKEADELSDLRHRTTDSGQKHLKMQEKNDEEEENRVTDEETESFLSLIQMYGGVIKNAELLDEKDKREHLEFYMYGMNLLYALLLIMCDRVKSEMAYDKLSEDDKASLNVRNRDEYEKNVEDVVAKTKITILNYLQNIIYENVGTPKLDGTINNLINDKSSKLFEKYMLTFLKFDLSQCVSKNDILKYIYDTNSPTILMLIKEKLSFYYCMHFKGISTSESDDLLTLITKVSLKLDPVSGLNTKTYHESDIKERIRKELNTK